MKEDNTIYEERFTIGQLAQLYNISARTLRLYHDIGLYEPQFVDVRTNYRYYTREQLPKLEMIIKMKSQGLSLKRIEAMISQHDFAAYSAILSEQIDVLDEQIAERMTARSSLQRQLTSCSFLANPPQFNNIFVEFIPKRKGVVFEIEPYDMRADYGSHSPWKTALEGLRSILGKYSVPPALFNQVGCMISQDSLLKNELMCCGAFILLGDTDYNIPQAAICAGTYICMYLTFRSGENRVEADGIQKLLAYIRENGYRIVGSYLCEIVAESSSFDYTNQTVIAKLQIPVRRESTTNDDGF